MAQAKSGTQKSLVQEIQSLSTKIQLTASERRRSLIAVIGCISVCGMGFGFGFPLLGIMMERMAVPEPVIGLNASMFAIATLVFSPFVPRLMAIMGTARFLTTCIFLCVISLLGFKAIPNIAFWFPLRFLTGASVAGIFVACEIWIIELSTDENRGRLIGIYGTSLAAGFALGPLLLLTTGTKGWAPFIGGASIIALSSLTLLLAKGLTPEIRQHSSKNTWFFLKFAPAALLAAAVFGALEGANFNFLPIYAMRSGFTDDTASIVLFGVALGNVGCQIPIGWLADKMDKRHLLAYCGLACALCASALPFVMDNAFLLFPILFFWGGTMTGLYTVALASIGDRFKGAELAAANASLAVMAGAGELIGPMSAGVAMDAVDPHGMPLVLAAIGGIFTLFVAYRIWTRS